MRKARNGSDSENLIFSAVQKCSARNLLAWAEQQFQASDFQDIAYFEPFYMKPPNITTSAKPTF